MDIELYSLKSKSIEEVAEHFKCEVKDLFDRLTLVAGRGDDWLNGDLISNITKSYAHRDIFVEHYAWAIPDDGAIEVIRKYPRIVEIGAGSGFWASLIQNGIECYDTDPWDRSYYHVEQGSHESIRKDHETLFLCWPPYNTPMAYKCLQAFKGTYVIYIGEGYGGCTADDDFHETLEKDWKLIEKYRLLQWSGIHDNLEVYKCRTY